jgi:hypothetical protein
MATGHGVATIDFGATPVAEKSFTITDAAIAAGMLIEAFVSAGDTHADNNTEAHNHAAASWRLAPGLGAAGSFPLDVYCLMDLCHGNFKVRYAYAT